MAWKKPKKSAAEDPPPDIASDFENKEPPVAPRDAPHSEYRVYRWRGWFIAEWPMQASDKRPAGTGHLLFRREERARAFVELVKAGNNKAAFKLALARMRRDWNEPKSRGGSE